MSKIPLSPYTLLSLSFVYLYFKTLADNSIRHARSRHTHWFLRLTSLIGICTKNQLKFERGHKVEVSSNEAGSKESFYFSSVISSISKFIIQYRILLNDDNFGPQREFVFVDQVRVGNYRENLASWQLSSISYWWRKKLLVSLHTISLDRPSKTLVDQRNEPSPHAHLAYATTKKQIRPTI